MLALRRAVIVRPVFEQAAWWTGVCAAAVGLAFTLAGMWWGWWTVVGDCPDLSGL